MADGALAHRRRAPRSAARISPVSLLVVSLLVVALLVVALAACASPEAKRSRGGGPGADPGNRGAEVELHGEGPDPYFGTPVLGSASARTSSRAASAAPRSPAPSR
jgi:hypothetical protein